MTTSSFPDRRLPIAKRIGLIGALALLVALIVSGVSAADNTGLSSTVGLNVLVPTPNEVVTGTVLPIQVLANGYRIDARYAGTPNQPTVGHYHEILDGNLVDMTPYQDGNRDTMPMVGVTHGLHTLTLVPASDDHSTITSAAINIPFYYEGPYLPEPAGYIGSGSPGITITAPADGSTVQGSSFTMTASFTNFVMCGQCFGKPLVAGEGHWHIFLDQVDLAHMLTMGSDTSQTVSLKGVTQGWHTFYAVLVDNHHMPIMPMTMTAENLYVQSSG
jgi:hypothetical protein